MLLLLEMLKDLSLLRLECKLVIIGRARVTMAGFKLAAVSLIKVIRHVV